MGILGKFVYFFGGQDVVDFFFYHLLVFFFDGFLEARPIRSFTGLSKRGIVTMLSVEMFLGFEYFPFCAFPYLFLVLV